MGGFLKQKKKTGKKTQSEKRRDEKLARLRYICCGARDKDPLSDDEMISLEEFTWNSKLLEEIKRTRQRPLYAKPRGFYKRCKECGEFDNYCRCADLSLT